MAQRVTFYIDGFNFYYGLRRTKCNEPQWGDYYWIDMVKLCEGFLGEGQQFEKVIYFTASPLNPEKSSRQSAFLNANKLLNGERFEVVRGKYLDKQIQCHICHPSTSSATKPAPSITPSTAISVTLSPNLSPRNPLFLSRSSYRWQIWRFLMKQSCLKSW